MEYKVASIIGHGGMANNAKGLLEKWLVEHPDVTIISVSHVAGYHWPTELLIVYKETAEAKTQASKEIVPYQYHGRAKDMPKRLRDYFASKEILFLENEMVDIVEHVEIELVNRWEAGN